GLGYVIKDEMIQVTTLAKVKDMMTLRAYPIGDLIAADRLYQPAAWANQQESDTVKYIIDMIKRSVDPMSWDNEAGGTATITFDPITKWLIIRQSAEGHMLLRNSMK